MGSECNSIITCLDIEQKASTFSWRAANSSSSKPTADAITWLADNIKYYNLFQFNSLACNSNDSIIHSGGSGDLMKAASDWMSLLVQVRLASLLWSEASLLWE